MMKKLVTLVLALALMLSLCIPTSAEQQVVTFWSHQNVAWNASWEELIAEFEAQNPDIRIEYTNFPYSDFEAKTQTSLMASDAGADVYEVWGGWMLDFASTGALSEVPDELMADLLEDSYEPVLGTLQYEGKYYGAPLELNSGYGGMVVNKKLFEENGIAYPTTWEEVINIAREVSVSDGNIMEMRGLEYAGSDALFFNWLAMILQKGGDFRTEDGRIVLDSEIAIECMEELVSYITVDHINNLDTQTNALGIGEHAFVCLDECYMVTNGPWIIADCEASYGLTYGEDFEYIAQPAFVEGVEQKWAAETGWSLCVAKKSQVSDAAWKFISFVMEEENLLKHNIACAQIPPRKSVAENPAYLESMPYMKPAIDILSKSVYVGSFNTGIVKGFITQMFIALCSEDGTYASVEEACHRLQAEIDAKVKFY